MRRKVKKVKKSRKRLSIGFVEVEDPWERAYLKKRFQGLGKLSFFNGTTQEVLVDLRELDVLSVFIKSKVDAKAFHRLPNLKLVTTRSTGFDHIDLKEARKRSIPVSNVPTYGENTVAEHTFALILSLSRNLKRAYTRSIRGDFSIKGLMGFDLKGKTLGVIGTGNIGLHVIRMAIAFGMNVVAFDVRQQRFLSEVLGFEYVSMDELLKKSDILSLHVPYMPSTRHLINTESIRKIKKGAVLINTARGGLVQTHALVKALDEDILSGVGLDVLEEEEFILEEKRFAETPKAEKHWEKIHTILKNHVLLHRQNVIYTPHMAFYSQEAVQRILDTTFYNVKNFIKGEPINLVTHKKGK